MIEARYSTTPFAGAIGYSNFVGIADATRYHLRSAHRIIATLLPDQPDFLSGLDQVLLRLEVGLPAPLLDLIQIPVVLTRGQYLALGVAGVRRFSEIDRLDEATLASCIDVLAAARLLPPAVEDVP